MLNELPFELVSSILSIIILIALGYKYLQYKKTIDVIKQLDLVKTENALTQEDLNFIDENEKEYSQKVISTSANIKLMNPVFILIVGVLLLMFPWQEAMTHANVVVVAFLFMQIDKIHKKNNFITICANKIGYFFS